MGDCSFTVGTCVEVFRSAGRQKGKIHAVDTLNGTYTVKWNDGTCTADIPRENVRLLGAASPASTPNRDRGSMVAAPPQRLVNDNDDAPHRNPFDTAFHSRLFSPQGSGTRLREDHMDNSVKAMSFRTDDFGLTRCFSFPHGESEGGEHVMDDEDEVESIDQVIQVKDLIQHMILDVKRVYTYRGLPIFLISLILFTLSAGLTFISGNDRSVFYMCDSVENNLMHVKEFRKITTTYEFYEWLHEIAPNFWVSEEDIRSWQMLMAVQGTPVTGNVSLPTRAVITRRSWRGRGFFTERQNTPLHWLLIRQHRVQAQTCDSDEQASPINKYLWGVIKKECWGEYDRADLDGRPFRRNISHPLPPHWDATMNPFTPDSDPLKEGELPPLRDARGQIRDYRQSSKQFTVALPFESLSLEDVRETISDLEASEWLDFSTRLINIETMLYNPVRGQYVVVHFTLEVSHAGITTHLPYVRPFWFLLMNRWPDGLLFGLDVLYAMYIGWILKDILWHIRTNLRLGSPPVGFWELMAAAHVLMLVLYLSFRFTVWHLSESIGEDLDRVTLYSRLTNYQNMFESARNFFIAALWLDWLRLLEFLRYNARLNAVTETIRLAAQDLLSLFVITFFIILSFGFVGNAVYGWNHREFATVGDSVSWLIRKVFSADMSDYNQLVELEPTWTPIYLLAFFCLSWLILLNVVLGILAAGFSAAAATTADRSWSLKGIQRDMREFLKSLELMQDQSHTRLPNAPDDTQVVREQSDETIESRVGRERKGCFCTWCCDFLGFRSHYLDRRIQSVRCLRTWVNDKREEHERNEDMLIESGKKHEWQRAEFRSTAVFISLAELLEPKFRNRGWLLGRKDTVATFAKAKALTVSSFQDAEEQRRLERKSLIASIDRLGKRLRRSMLLLVNNAQRSLGGQLDAVERYQQEELGRQLAEVGGQMVDTRTKMLHNNESLEKKVQEVHGSLSQLSKEEAERVLTGVLHGLSTQNRYFSTIDASINESEGRIRAEIVKRSGGGEVREADVWLRDLESREMKLRDMERRLKQRERELGVAPSASMKLRSDPDSPQGLLARPWTVRRADSQSDKDGESPPQSESGKEAKEGDS